MKNYSQSIVIPTRNRAETAIYAIESCLNVEYENKQIVVVDNSDGSELKGMLASKDWLSKVTYHKNDSVLPMRDNWEVGLELATGELVSVIGDDDAILADSMSIANFAFNRAKIDVLAGGSAIYKWPNYPYQGRRNYLSFGFGENIKIIRNPREILRESYNYDQIMGTGPGLYYGFVKRDFLLKIKKIRGRYLKDYIPDFDSGYATLLYSDSYAISERPLFVQGHSAKSNSGSMRFASTHSKNIQIFINENNGGQEQVFDKILGSIASNNSVIVSAQLRFQNEINKVLGPNATELNKEKAWRYIVKGLSEGYDIVEYLSAIPSLKQLAAQWNIPYTLKDEYQPYAGDSSLDKEQGFIKINNAETANHSTLGAGYGSVVINGASLGFNSIMDAVRLIDSMLPTMRASSDSEMIASAIEMRMRKVADKLKFLHQAINGSNFILARNIIDEILTMGELNIDIDKEVDLVLTTLGDKDEHARYCARRFTSTGNSVYLKKLIELYRALGNEKLAEALVEGLMVVMPAVVKEISQEV